MRRRPIDAKVTLRMAPMTPGAVTLDAQECRDIETYASNFMAATGSRMVLDPVKFAAFERAGIDMGLFRITETMQ